MLEQFKEIILNYIDIDPKDITPESGIRELGLNSYDFMSIIAACEEKFSIVVPDRDIPGMETVSDVVSYLESARK